MQSARLGALVAANVDNAPVTFHVAESAVAGEFLTAAVKLSLQTVLTKRGTAAILLSGQHIAGWAMVSAASSLSREVRDS
jgi:hypothetical protein